jgi:two-component sensor histidine kinase
LLAVNILTLTSGGRDTLGWLLGRASWMLSSSILFLFLMAQFAGQLRFLAHVKNTLETEVQRRTADLTGALRQRDLLLREVYHRVKNNMQVIDSMLFLESRKVSPRPTPELIDILRKRVFALGLVHQQLTDSRNMEYFRAAPFIRALVENLGTSQAAQEHGVTLETGIDEIEVNLDFAIPLGLLITELVTNSFKHAHAQTISIFFHRCGAHLVNLTVQDDGADYDTTGIKLDPDVMSNGQGSKIVDGLVRQLDGKLEITRDKGMRTSISMPLPEEGLLG